MDFWLRMGEQMPDWAATVAFLVLALLFFVCFVISESSSPTFIWLLVISGGVAAYLYWYR